MQIKNSQETSELMDKRTRLLGHKRKQLDLIDEYKRAFRRVEGLYNSHCSKEKYSLFDDIDIEEDLFDSDESDSEQDDNDDTTVVS